MKKHISGSSLPEMTKRLYYYAPRRKCLINLFSGQLIVCAIVKFIKEYFGSA